MGCDLTVACADPTCHTPASTGFASAERALCDPPSPNSPLKSEPRPQLEPTGAGLIGASTAVFDATGRVLLIRRAKPPLAGLWSLPGGHIEPGEAPAATALREVHEETGLVLGAVWFLTRYDVPVRSADGEIERSLPLAVFCGWAPPSDTPHAAGDVDAARFVERSDLGAYPLTENCAQLVEAAWLRLQAGP